MALVGLDGVADVLINQVIQHRVGLHKSRKSGSWDQQQQRMFNLFIGDIGSLSLLNMGGQGSFVITGS